MSVGGLRHWWATVGAIVLIVGVVVALATTMSRAARPSTASASGNRAAARQDAARLLDQARLPADAMRLASEPRGDGGLLGRSIGSPLGAAVVDDHAFWTIPEPLADVRRFVSVHPPVGSTQDGTGTSGGPDVPDNASISFAFHALPSEIASRSLSINLVALGPDLTGARVDAQDVWLVPRSGAQRVPPGVTSLTIKQSDTHSSGGASSGVAFTYTLTNRTEIATITRWLDALPIVQPGATSCPAQPVTARQEQITFLGPRGGNLAQATQRESVTRPTTVCDALTFTIRSQPQPALLNGPRFLGKVNRLVGIPPTP